MFSSKRDTRTAVWNVIRPIKEFGRRLKVWRADEQENVFLPMFLTSTYNMGSYWRELEILHTHIIYIRYISASVFLFLFFFNKALLDGLRHGGVQNLLNTSPHD